MLLSPLIWPKSPLHPPLGLVMRPGMHFSSPNSIFHSWGDSAASDWTGLRGQPVYTLGQFKAGFMNLERDFHAVYTTVKLSADAI